MGHAIIADPVYGTAVEGKRLQLHARGLAVPHPISGAWVEAACPAPADFSA
jgi:23S rRNA-/tRNA-specific pseudouridylate synthase